MYPAKKNVSKEGENNSQFMTRESEARASAPRCHEHRRIAPKSALAEIFIEISFHPSYCRSASSQLGLNHYEVVN
jgi:hypothetical protein